MSLNIPNLDRLISHLEGLPEENFNMRYLSIETTCGTVGCIAGWCCILAERTDQDLAPAANWLGLPWLLSASLFCPPGYFGAQERYPLSRAIRTLKHMRSEYLRTGQVVVDWDAPEPVTKAAWTAPHATERKLPAEIVRFLSPADLEVSA